MGLPKTLRNHSSPLGRNIQLAVSPQIFEQSIKSDILPQISRGIPRWIESFKSTRNRIRQLRAPRCGLLHLLDHVYQGTCKWPGINPGFWDGDRWQFNQNNVRIAYISNFGIPFAKGENKVKIRNIYVEVLSRSKGISTFISLDSFLIKVHHRGANSFFLGLSLIFSSMHLYLVPGSLQSYYTHSGVSELELNSVASTIELSQPQTLKIQMSKWISARTEKVGFFRMIQPTKYLFDLIRSLYDSKTKKTGNSVVPSTGKDVGHNPSKGGISIQAQTHSAAPTSTPPQGLWPKWSMHRSCEARRSGKAQSVGMDGTVCNVKSIFSNHWFFSNMTI